MEQPRNTTQLCQLALLRYGTKAKFAEAMGWDKSKAGRILNGKQDPSLRDIKTMSEKMSLPNDVLVCIFWITVHIVNQKGGERHGPHPNHNPPPR